jgi:hypothetical protein
LLRPFLKARHRHNSTRRVAGATGSEVMTQNSPVVMLQRTRAAKSSMIRKSLTINNLRFLQKTQTNEPVASEDGTALDPRKCLD